MFKKNLLLILLISIFQQSLLAETIKVFDFVETEFANLKVKKVRGAYNKTKYSIWRYHKIGNNTHFVKGDNDGKRR